MLKPAALQDNTPKLVTGRDCESGEDGFEYKRRQCVMNAML
jgi:hypothetical protein